MGRIQQAKKNIAFGFVSNFVILFMNFLQRTIFILILGQTLTGVNSLFFRYFEHAVHGRAGDRFCVKLQLV